MNEIIARILKENNSPELLNILTGMKSSDLQSLMLEVYRARSSELKPGDVLKQYEKNRFTVPAGITPLEMLEFEKLAYGLLPEGFETVLFSPLSPLGTCSVLGTVNQNKVVSTARNNEVCADSTNMMALESAKRRKSLPPEDTVKLASCHRLMRAQSFDNPAFSAHFSIFALTTAGKMSADSLNLLEALREHIRFYLKFLKESVNNGFVIENFQVFVTAINSSLKQKLEKLLILPLSGEFPDFFIKLDQDRTSGLNYYRDLALAIKIKSPVAGNTYALIDGGNTDWTGKVLNNHKEFFLTSCIGVDLFLKMFRQKKKKY